MQLSDEKQKYFNMGYITKKVLEQNKDTDRNRYLKILEKHNNKYTSNLFKQLYPYIVEKNTEYELGYDDLLEQTSILLITTEELNNTEAGYYFTLGLTSSDKTFTETQK